MAELPRYRPLGARIGSMPSIDFVQTGRAQAGVYSTIVSGLDKMAEYLYEKEAARAALAGAKYGAENAPTISQLEQARQSGSSIAGEIIGDETVFGKAARKSAIDVITINAETAARNAMTQLRLNARENDMTADQLQVELNGLIDGYTSVIAGIDPLAAKKFEASIATTANSHLLAHANDQLDKAEARQKIAVEDDIQNNIFPQISDIIAGGNTFDPFGDVVTPQARLDALRDRGLTLTSAVADESMAAKFLADFSKKESEAYVGRVRDWLSDEPIVHMTQLQSGDIQDPNIRNIIDILSPEEKRQAMDQAYDVLSRELALESSIETKNERTRKTLSIDVRRDIVSEMTYPGSTGKNIEDLLDRLDAIDPEAALVFSEKVYSSPTANDPDTIIQLNKMDVMGQMSHDILLNSLDNGLITFSEYQKRFNALDNMKDEDYSLAKEYIKNAINPVPSLLGGGDDEANREIGQILNELMLAKRRNPELDPIDWAVKRIKNREGTGPSAEAVEKAQKIIDAFARQRGIDSDLASVNSEIANIISEGGQSELRRYDAVTKALETLKAAQR